MRPDLVLQNGAVITPASSSRTDIAIKDGRIVALGRAAHFQPAARTLDLAGKQILPGVIDVHCHFREPGLTHKEDFVSGTIAAAMGGVTTVFEMPNTLPPVASAAAFEQKAEALRGRAYVDYCLWGTIDPAELSRIESLAACGAIGFKIFLAGTTGDLASPNAGALFEAFQLIGATGLRTALHAEERSFIEHFTHKFQQAGRRDYRAVAAARAPIAEALALARALLLAHRAGNKIHIAHLTTAAAVELLQFARSKGVDVSAETCPHYLLLESCDCDRLGPAAQVLPPLRSAADARALWVALAAGEIDLIASDHAPHSAAEKQAAGDSWAVPAGIAGVETAVPLMLEQVNRGRLTLNDYVRLACENPARRFNLYPRKGTIQSGADADLTVIDLAREYTITAARLHSKAKLTPFEGFSGRGCPLYTIVRGQIVMAEGRLLGGPAGRLLKPSL